MEKPKLFMQRQVTRIESGLDDASIIATLQDGSPRELLNIPSVLAAFYHPHLRQAKDKSYWELRVMLNNSQVPTSRVDQMTPYSKDCYTLHDDRPHLFLAGAYVDHDASALDVVWSASTFDLASPESVSLNGLLVQRFGTQPRKSTS